MESQRQLLMVEEREKIQKQVLRSQCPTEISCLDYIQVSRGYLEPVFIIDS